jgi:hypothetical protein
MWPFSTNIPEQIVKKSDEETYCEQMAFHVREVLRSKILMDDATKKLYDITRTTPYKCKDYARAIEKSNNAQNDFTRYMTI